MASITCSPPPAGDRVVVTGFTHSKEFEAFRRGIEDTFCISLPAVSSDLLNTKQFFSGLLTSRDHLWSRPIRTLPLRDRLSISGSLFLFRKILPSPVPSVQSYLDKMSEPAPDPPAGYLRFVADSVSTMFRQGWDRGWERRVLNVTLNTSSCLESSRKDGGARALLLWCRQGFPDRSEFCRDLLDRYSTLSPKVDFARVAHAPCAGKVRTVSVNSSQMNYLKPYHTLVYDHLSRMDWLLRGDAKVSCFSGFVQKDGEIFVSGDYEAATDNLNQDVARQILISIGRRCRYVPLFVREAALSTLGGTLSGGGKTVTQRRGQLMGNAMSFPLLCLQNYLAFKFLIRRDVPVRINGDDIVFRATPEEVDSWVKGVTACGLKLSLGKTNFEKRWFSLNSTFFCAGRKYVRLAPVVRSTAIFSALDDAGSLAGRLETLRGFRPDRRIVWEKLMLSRASTVIWSSQRSLTRGLDCRVSKRAIVESGLRDRECFYRALPDKCDQRFVADYNYTYCPIPSGWYRARLPTRRATPQEFIDELVDECWYPREEDRKTDYELSRVRTSRYVRARSNRVLRLAHGPLRAMCMRKKLSVPDFKSLGFPDRKSVV